MFKLYQKGRDAFGPYWWIKVGKKYGLSVAIFTSGIEIGATIEFIYNEDCKWISFQFFWFTMAFFFEPDWD